MASITKLQSGKYRARVRVGGQYRGESFSTKAAAKRWAAKIEGQLVDSSAGIKCKVAGMTVGNLVAAYRDEVAELPGAKTGRTKLASLKMLETRLADLRLERIDAGLDQFITRRQKEGAGGVTIAADLSFLSTVLRWASVVKNVAVDELAARRARSALTVRGMDTRSHQRDRMPSGDELQALYGHWAAMKRQKIPMERITKFALATGMRLGEICRIQIDDINWDARSVMIRERKDPKHKDRNDQVVPLVGESIDLAREQAGGRKSGRLFPYDSKSVGTSFVRATKELGFPGLRFHDMRHAATTEFFRMGLPIHLVAIITGHKSWENLRRYTELTAKDVHNHLARK